jgi:hypothetical protein
MTRSVRLNRASALSRNLVRELWKGSVEFEESVDSWSGRRGSNP